MHNRRCRETMGSHQGPRLPLPAASIRSQLHNGACPGRLLSPSTRIKSCTAAAAGFQHSLKGAQGGEQNLGTLFLGVVGGLAERFFR